MTLLYLKDFYRMDIAVFSDIHSNYIALQTCFEYCITKGITNFLLLGDYVTDCPYPQKTMEILKIMKQHFNCVFIRGNREEYLLNYQKKGEQGWKDGSASGSLLYTYENLTVRDLNFFRTMPIYGAFTNGNYPGFEYCHGSPTDCSELLFRDKRNTRRTLSNLKTDILVHGHNHVQEVYEYRGKKSVNPGSIGIPWYHGGKTQFIIMHGDGRFWETECLQLEYDRAQLLKDFESSGLMERAPAWAALTMHTIRTGVDLNEIVLLRAMQLCSADKGEAKWPDIPEIYWAFALRENNVDLNGKDIPHRG